MPERLLVIGGGIIGLEMATVHDALGSKVVVVEMLDELMAGADPDVVKPLRKRIEKRYEAIHTGTKVEAIKATDDGIVATYGGNDETFDRVLVAVGRRPNGGAHRRRQGGRGGRRARLHLRRRADAHERGATSSRSATWSASRCSPTRPRTRRRSRPR